MATGRGRSGVEGRCRVPAHAPAHTRARPRVGAQTHRWCPAQLPRRNEARRQRASVERGGGASGGVITARESSGRRRHTARRRQWRAPRSPGSPARKAWKQETVEKQWRARAAWGRRSRGRRGGDFSSVGVRSGEIRQVRKNGATGRRKTTHLGGNERGGGHGDKGAHPDWLQRSLCVRERGGEVW